MHFKTVGVPKEIKDLEGRVGLRPCDVKLLTNKGLKVFVENEAGVNSGYSNEDYINSGADILLNRDLLFNKSDLIIKVKEPMEHEISYLKNLSKTFFCYFHFATSKLDLDKTNVANMIPFEEIVDNGKLPLLFPMSEIAGKLSVYKAAELLLEDGVLLSGAAGVAAANILILGGGVVGFNAAKTAFGLGANVCILDRSVARLAELNELLPMSRNLFSNENNLNQELVKADIIIGAVHSKGAKTDMLIKYEHFDLMKKGSIFLDISIDQGGCSIGSKLTSHSSPTYMFKHTKMYCVPNVPGLTPKTSTEALCNSTEKYIHYLIDNGNLDKFYKKE